MRLCENDRHAAHLPHFYDGQDSIVGEGVRFHLEVPSCVAFHGVLDLPRSRFLLVSVCDVQTERNYANLPLFHSPIALLCSECRVKT